MATIDPKEERKRLAELYSAQQDGELEQVAGQAYELSDLAREALRAELAKRGLNTPVLEYPPGDQVEMREMVTIRQFRDLPPALLAKGSLDSAGIDNRLVDDNVVRLDWLWSNAVGGVKLQVPVEDEAAAEEVLAQPIPENFEVDEVGEYEQPHCPKCNSLDISFRELDPTSYLTLAVNIPIPFLRQAWRCHSCNAEWEDDGAPNPAESPT